jgi:hypothetical protein
VTTEQQGECLSSAGKRRTGGGAQFAWILRRQETVTKGEKRVSPCNQTAVTYCHIGVCRNEGSGRRSYVSWLQHLQVA